MPEVNLRTMSSLPQMPVEAAGATQAMSANASVMSEPPPLACFGGDDQAPDAVADTAAAKMLREQMAARVTENSRQTGADGAGQGDGPTMLSDLTPEQAEQKRKDAEDSCKVAVPVVTGGVGAIVAGPFGGAIGGPAGSMASTEWCKTPSTGDPGAAGASSTNPLDRDVRGQIF